jgi:hypothetical protein
MPAKFEANLTLAKTWPNNGTPENGFARKCSTPKSAGL